MAHLGATDRSGCLAPRPAAAGGRQGGAWRPRAAGAARVVGAPLAVGEGVVHVAQSPESLARLGAAVRAHGPWELTALHDLVSISGSLVIGLAVSRGRLDAATAWPLSRIDEDWQIEEWGEDDEAAALAGRRRADFASAARLLELVRAVPR